MTRDREPWFSDLDGWYADADGSTVTLDGVDYKIGARTGERYERVYLLREKPTDSRSGNLITRHLREVHAAQTAGASE